MSISSQDNTTDQVEQQQKLGYFGFKLNSGEEIIGLAAISDVQRLAFVMSGFSGSPSTNGGNTEDQPTFISVKAPYKFFISQTDSPVLVKGIANVAGNTLHIMRSSLASIPTAIYDTTTIHAYNTELELLNDAANLSSLTH